MKRAYPAFRSQGSFHSPGQTAVVPFAVGLPRHRVPCAQTRFIHTSDRSNADIDLELGSPAGVATPPALRNPHRPLSQGHRPDCPAPRNRGPHRRGAPATEMPAFGQHLHSPNCHTSSKIQEGTGGPEGPGGDLEARRRGLGSWLFYLIAVETADY